jgi:hypothetical protein
MVFWILGFFLLLIALMIPILAIVLDSPVARNFVRGADPAKLDEIMRRIETLETELSNLDDSVETLKEETQFVQRLLEKADGQDPQRQLSPPES